jgi:Na+/proline symporter
VVIYPIAILLIWLPCIFLGVVGAQAIPGLKDSDGILLRLLNDNAPAWLAGLLGAGIISAVMGSDAHQILAMSTMFTKDIYVHYGGHKKYGERSAVYFARGFIVIVTLIAYVIALYLKSKQGIFEIAIRFAFSGFAAMAPVMIAALFWKRSTKWGALASTIFVGATLIGFALLQGKPAIPPAPLAKPATAMAKKDADTNSNPMAVMTTNAIIETNLAKADAAVTNTLATAGIITTNPLSTNAPDLSAIPLVKANAPAKLAAIPTTGAPPAPKMDVIWKVGDHIILSRAPATGDVRFWNASANPAGGYMTVVPMVFGSALCMIIFSLLSRPPSDRTIQKYFSDR